MSSRIRSKFFLWAARHKLASGGAIPPKPFQNFVLDLDPPERKALWELIPQLQHEGLIKRIRPHIANLSLLQSVGDLRITDAGQDAIYDEKQRQEAKGSSVHSITNMNIHGSHVQIGDGNTMNVSNFFSKVEEIVDSSNASEGEKVEAKSILRQVADNNLLAGILTSVGGAAIKSLLGIP